MTGSYADLPLIEQFIRTFAALILVSSFALLAQARVVAAIQVFAWQGFLLAGLTAMVAWNLHLPHLYISAVLTLELDAVIRPGLTLLAAGALVIFCYNVVIPVREFAEVATRDAIAVSLALVMIALLMLITRRKAITQVVAFMSLENGLFFAAVTATQGMPMVVELGIAFDVLIAAVIFGVFFFHIRDSIDSLDVDQLSRLREHDE
jgi:hydrogenase-4 component E